MKEKNARYPCQGDTLTRLIQPILFSLLSQAPTHGYDLVQKIGKTALWREAPPDATGVYRMLHDMEQRGLVSSHLDADSIAGVGKRVFQITPAGRACMQNWLRTLREYRDGVNDVIARLEETVSDTEDGGGKNCCCGG